MELPDRAALLAALRVRRNQVLLAVAALLLAVRVALPHVLRPIIVEQADAALVGRIALRDLDLSLIRGGVTLHGFEVYADELPPPTSPVEQKPPLFAAERLWVQISWLELVLKTIDVEELELDDFTVRLDRLKDGLVLPKPAPSAEPAPPTPEPEAPSTWAFAAQSLALTKGAVVFQDYTVGEQPQRFDLAIPNLAARKLALRFDPSGREPGHVALEADIGGGKISFEADLEQKQAGPATHTNIVLANLPIGGVRVYLKMFGWSELQGMLDASIDHRFETDGAHEVSGVVSLSDVRVNVPELEDRPALAFQKLSIALDKLDVVKQHAAVSDVTLAGARVVIDPRSKNPLPFLEPPAVKEPPEEPAPSAEAPPPAPAQPWTWTLKRARLENAELDLLGAADPLVLRVDAQVKTLASPTTGTSPVSLAVREGDGGLELSGDLTLEPMSFKGKLAIRELALAPLAARAPAPGAELLRGGRARAELEVILAGRGASAPGVSDLRVAGTLGLAGLEVGKPGDEDFSAAWKDLAIQIREITVQPAIGGDAAKPRAVALTLDRVQLTEPDVSLTRTEKGLVLPELGGAGNAAEAPPPAPAAPAPAPDVRVKVEKLKLERGRVRIADRSVKPFYEGRIEQLDFLAGKVAWPPLQMDPLVADLKGLHGAVLHVHGGINPPPGVTRVRAELDSLPLAPFNPYVAQSGFSLANGSLALDATAHMENQGYDTSADVAIQALEVGGAEGEALFEENFGIPLSMALGLLKDQSGVISLNVPIAGDAGGARVGLASLAGQALRKALLGALASPLKLLGVSTRDGKVESLRPEPVEFLLGGTEPSEAGNARIDQLAVLLASAPGISLALHGGTSEGDLRALRERALLAELERTSGIRALGKLGEIGLRSAVRKYLDARATGEPAPDLDVEQRAWLEAQLPLQPLSAGALEALAEKRASALSETLVTKKGIAAERISVGPLAPAGSLPIPGVAIEVGARTAPAQ